MLEKIEDNQYELSSPTVDEIRAFIDLHTPVERARMQLTLYFDHPTLPTHALSPTYIRAKSLRFYRDGDRDMVGWENSWDGWAQFIDASLLTKIRVILE